VQAQPRNAPAGGSDALRHVHHKVPHIPAHSRVEEEGCGLCQGIVMHTPDISLGRLLYAWRLAIMLVISLRHQTEALSGVLSEEQ
jgi:hypothetical protein